MSAPQDARSNSMAQLFLRFAQPLSRLRRLPLVGPLVGWASGKLVPRGTLAWAQVQSGPATGLWLHLNPRTGSLYFAGGGEPAVQAALQEQLRPGMVVYDIGANIGFFSLLAGRLVGANGRVFAFEADPEVAARLCEHISRNELPWITAEQKAVWREATTVSFARTDPATSPDRGLGHVVPTPGSDTIRVEAVSLDGFTRYEPSPDFVKCDVEGAEVEVFRGAQRLLAEKRPGILCEVHSEENRRILLEEFARHRYTCTALDEHHVLALPR